MPTWVFWLIAILFSLIGVYYIALGVMEIDKFIAHRYWVMTDAKIILCHSAKIKELLQVSSPWKRLMNLMGILSAVPESLFSHAGNAWFVITRYEYTIMGQNYQNQEIVRHGVRFDPGILIKCMVNPSNPANSSSGKRSVFDFLNLLLGLIIVGIAVGLLVAIK